MSSSRHRRGTERRPDRPPVRSHGDPFLPSSQTPGRRTHDAESSKPLPQSQLRHQQPNQAHRSCNMCPNTAEK